MTTHTDTPDEPAVPKAHDIPTRKLLHPWRRRYFTAFVALTVLAILTAMSAGALTMTGSNWSPVGIIVVAVEMILLVAGFVWLALLVTSRRAPGKSSEETPSKTD